MLSCSSNRERYAGTMRNLLCLTLFLTACGQNSRPTWTTCESGLTNGTFGDSCAFAGSCTGACPNGQTRAECRTGSLHLECNGFPQIQITEATCTVAVCALTEGMACTGEFECDEICASDSAYCEGRCSGGVFRLDCQTPNSSDASIESDAGGLDVSTDSAIEAGQG